MRRQRDWFTDRYTNGNTGRWRMDRQVETDRQTGDRQTDSYS